MPAQSDLWGGIELVSAPAGYAVSLERAKRQCRVDLGEDDTDLQLLIKEAAAFVEGEIYGNRQLMFATFDLRVADFACWPCVLRLPRPPLSSLTSVKYYDTDDALTTLASSVYLVRTPWQQPGTIELAPNQVWPTCNPERRHPVVIRFVAGYVDGATATAAQIEAAIPPQVTRAMLMLIGHWYANRESVLVGIISKEVEMGVASLLSQCGWGSYA